MAVSILRLISSVKIFSLATRARQIAYSAYCVLRTFVCVRQTFLKRTFLLSVFPHNISLFAFNIGNNWKMKKTFRLTTMHQSKCENYFIKTWFPRSLHAATRNSEGERFFETFKAFKLSLGPLKISLKL